MREMSIREAKNTLSRLVHEAETGKSVRLTRRGKPVAVLVSEREYERLKASRLPRRSFADFLPKWRADLPPDWQGITDEEVDSWRDRSPDGGRPPFAWDD